MSKNNFLEKTTNSYQKSQWKLFNFKKKSVFKMQKRTKNANEICWLMEKANKLQNRVDLVKEGWIGECQLHHQRDWVGRKAMEKTDSEAERHLEGNP